MAREFHDRGPPQIEADRLTASRLIAGDDRVMWDIVDRSGQALLATARLITGDRAAAEDVVQDVLAGLWCKPTAYDPERGALSSWLLMRCRGAAIDNVRSRSARSRREVFVVAGERYDEEDRYPVVSASAAVGDALRTLGAPDRELIELTFFVGLSYRAAAELLGIPEGTVKSRIRRVLVTLKCQLVPALAA